MKNKKLIAGLALGLTLTGSGLFMTGCNNLDIDQTKVDNLIEKGDKFLDTQNDIDYEKLAEEFQEFLYRENTNNKEYAFKYFKNKLFSMLNMAHTNNYTMIIGDKVTRVEYVSNSLTKVYCYTLNNNQKQHEVYMEITSENVTTYVKDLNMYSTVNMEILSNIDDYVSHVESISERSILCFNSHYDVVLKDSANNEYVTWDNLYADILEKENDNVFIDNDSIVDYKENVFATLNGMFNSDYEDLGSFIDFTIENNKITIKSLADNFFEGDEDSLSFIETGTFILELTDNTYKATSTIKYSSEGIPGSFKESSQTNEIVFDTENKNTINFDKTGYILVEDYYASQE